MDMLSGSNGIENHVLNVAWLNVFRILGVGRCQPLLRYAGVPAEMSGAPEGLARAAHYFWQRTWDSDPINVGPDWEPGDFTEEVYAEYLENYRIAVASLVADTFNLLVDYYGEAPATDLREWAQRNFIDNEQVVLWSIWCRLWLRMVGESSLIYPLVRPALRPGALKRVKKTVRKHLPLLCIDETEDGPEAELLRQAVGMPTSPVERRMLAIEVLRPDDPPEVDVLLRLKFVIRQHGAYSVWQELDAWLGAANREALLRWGKEQAAVVGEATEITLPVHITH